MIAEVPRVAARGGWIERTADVRLGDGRFELRSEAPVGQADTSGDATGILCALLPVAMRLGEDLEVRGPVSATLLGRVEEIQRYYAAADPGMRRVAVHARPGPAGEGGRALGAFFSRGVDSVHLAARRDDLTHLLFVDGLEPAHTGLVAAGEVAAAAELARRLGRELVLVRTNVRALVDPFGRSWEDFVAPALALAAHALAGWLGTAVVASSDEHETFELAGTGPLLDPLFSSERVTLEHDSLAWSRLEKTAWIAAHAPEMLEHLKVCFRAERVDNCGRCAKCLLTMACLEHAGALGAAPGFPDEIDLARVEAMRPMSFKARLEWFRVAQAVGGDLEAAVRRWLRATRLERPAPGEPWVEPRSLRDPRLNAMLALMLDGEPPPA
jgi:hypothetical protein